jgi:hypothetical protein
VSHPCPGGAAPGASLASIFTPQVSGRIPRWAREAPTAAAPRRAHPGAPVPPQLWRAAGLEPSRLACPRDLFFSESWEGLEAQPGRAGPKGRSRPTSSAGPHSVYQVSPGLGARGRGGAACEPVAVLQGAAPLGRALAQASGPLPSPAPDAGRPAVVFGQGA